MKHHASAIGRPMMAILLLFIAGSSPAQEGMSPGATPADAHYAELKGELDHALTMLAEAQRELVESRKQMDALEVRIQAMDEHLADVNKTLASSSNERASTRTQESVRELRENTQILQSEVKQHDQTKVESSSKYPVKISGMLLSSTLLADGAVDNADLPIVALARTGSVPHGGLTTAWRQSIFGLDAQGPSLWGGRSAADVRADFFGGQPMQGYSIAAGGLRLRTAHVHLDWTNSSLIASLDAPLISPREPTSYLSIAEPALAWSGNLWVWSPQIEFRQFLPTSNTGRLGLETGVIDTAAAASYFASGLRQANPSETSKQPGYESRVSYTLGAGDRTMIIGIGGYYGRQKYPYRQHIDAWAGSADWKLPLSRRFELSGELYRGRALSGLGGGAFKDYVLDEDTDRVHGLDAEGGWAQLKARFTPSIEANAAIGQDNAFGSQLRYAADYETPTIYSGLARNRTIIDNIVFRPKSYLLFSLEYRKIISWQISSPANDAQTFGLAIGYIY